MSSDMVHSEGWKMKRLGEIANLNYGKGLRSDKREPGSVPVYSSAGVTGYHNVPLVNEPGIIVGRKGSVGTVYLSEEPFYCIDTAYYIKKSEVKCDFKFLYYLLQTLGLENMNQDSAVPGLNRDHAHSLTTFVPDDVTEQKRIATILSTLDEKIELNHKTNQTLEEIARAVFKEWFIDFNYPGATGEMVDSPLGPIPKGWLLGRLSEIATISSGKFFNRKGIKDMGYPVIGANGKLGFAETYNLENEAIVTGRVGTLGTLQLINQKVWVTDNVLVVEPQKDFLFHYVYFWMRSIEFFNLNRGSTQPLLTKTDLMNQTAILPTVLILKTFNEFSRSLFNKIIKNKEENELLIKCRDLLIHELISR